MIRKHLSASAISACLVLGTLLPGVSHAQDLSSVQTKLKELGCFDRPVDGKQSLALKTGIRCFQKRAGLTPNGKLDAATLERLETAGDVEGIATMTGPCRASAGIIECALSDGTYAPAEDPWRSAAAKQMVLSELNCYDGAITGIEDDRVVKSLNCVRNRTGSLVEYQRKVALLLGQMTVEELDAIEAEEAQAAQQTAQEEEARQAELAKLHEVDDVYGTNKILIDKVRAAAAGMRNEAPEPFYSGPVFDGTRNATLYQQVQDGRFDAIPQEQRLDVVATYVALLIQQAAHVRRFGAECIYHGDRAFKFTLTQETRNGLGTITNSQVYEQQFWAPPTHESVARRAFGIVDINPGLNVLDDMARVVGREDCGSPRTALLRENLYRLQAGLAPTTLPDMQARYPRAAKQTLGGTTAVPDDWRPFATTCLQHRYSAFSVRPAMEVAQYCSCLERHFRAAELGDLYQAFVTNWERATDSYWYSPAVDPILATCNQNSFGRDRDHAETILRNTGIGNSPLYRP